METWLSPCLLPWEATQPISSWAPKVSAAAVVQDMVSTPVVSETAVDEKETVQPAAVVCWAPPQ